MNTKKKISLVIAGISVFKNSLGGCLDGIDPLSAMA